MKTKEIIKRAREFAKPFRISKGKDFRLKDVDPNNTLEFTKEADKPRPKEALATGVTALAELQDKLYAQDKWGVLLIFQAMDAAGKDGAIKHVMSGVNPQGCEVCKKKSGRPWRGGGGDPKPMVGWSPSFFTGGRLITLRADWKIVTSSQRRERTACQALAEENPNELPQNVMPVVICGPCATTSNLKLFSSKLLPSAR
jgi:hypothetical protein